MSITIIVNTVKTNPITVKVDLSDTVSEAKKKYVSQGGSAKFNQWIYDAEILEDNITLREVGISDKEGITANEASRGGLYQLKP
jgi:hypothetical protein